LEKSYEDKMNVLAQEKALKNLSDEPIRYSQTNIITQEGRAYFPYPDWWRGEYVSDIPIIVEREAGFRPRLEQKFWKGTTGHAYPQHCFRTGIKTRYPCYPECTSTERRYDPTLQRMSKLYLFR
jgi:hypothetical protein